MMSWKEVFISMGGNIGDVFLTFQKVFESLSACPQIRHIQKSKLYRTSPVSDLPQPFYLNAACRFYTSLSAFELLKHLQEIQRTLGQKLKPKNAPRIIDLDILFFNDEIYQTNELKIPHPHWKERLFVLIPLFDLVKTLKIPGENKEIDLAELIKNFAHSQSIEEVKR